MSQNFRIEDDRLIAHRYPHMALDPRQIWLTPKQFRQGAKFAKEQQINNFSLWYGGEDGDAKFEDLDLSWLDDLPDIYNVDIMVHPSEKSKIDALYTLNNLISLVYFGYNKKPLDHHRLQSIKSLYTHYDTSHLDGNSRFEHLPNLDNLKLWRIKKQVDCSFLGNLIGVKELDITWSKSIESLNGIENLTNLRRVSINRCSSLTDIGALLQCENLEFAWIESSKHLAPEAVIRLKQKGIDIRGGSAVTKILKNL